MHHLKEWRGCMRIVIYNPLQFICHCGVFKEVCIVCTSYISYNLRWVSSFITWPQEQKKDIIARESLVLISQLPFSILINDCICTTVSPWIWLMNRPHTYIDKYTYCNKNLKGLIHLVFRHLLGSGLRLFGPFGLWASWALDHFGFINIISLHSTYHLNLRL